MERVASLELSAEQTAEDAQPEGTGLTDACSGGEPIAHLSEQYATHNGEHQPADHAQHIVGRACADGLVDEPLAEPYHRQTEHYLPDAHHDAYEGIPTDAS